MTKQVELLAGGHKNSMGCFCFAPRVQRCAILLSRGLRFIGTTKGGGVGRGRDGQAGQRCENRPD